MKTSSHDLTAELEDAREMLAFVESVQGSGLDYVRRYIHLCELRLKLALARDCESVESVDQRTFQP